MASSKFLPLQDTDDSGLVDACDELTNIPEDKACPPCQKNVNYIAPDWKTKTAEEPWFNEKTCMYQITIVTNEYTLIPEAFTTSDEANRHVSDIFEEYRTQAIDGILVYFEKDNTDANIRSLESVIENEKYYLDYRPNSRVKLLYSISYEHLELIPDATDEQDEEDDESETNGSNQGDYTISYDASDFNSKALKVRKALNMYGGYLKVFRATTQSNLIFSDDNRVFHMKSYGDNGVFGTGIMESVVKDIDKFLNKNGYKLPGGRPSGLLKDIVNEISFSFSNEYKLKKIEISTRDCADKVITFKSKKIRSLTKKGNFKDKTAMHYLFRINEMVDSLSAREPPNWSDFAIGFTYPTVELVENWPLSGNRNSAGSCIGDQLINESKQLGQDILDIDFSIADSIFYQTNKNACKGTVTQLRREDYEFNLAFNADYNTRENIAALAKEQAYKNLTIDGQIFLSACERMLSAGDTGNSRTSMRETFNNILDRLKLCGLKDLMVDAISCLSSDLSFEVVTSRIVKAALQNMSLNNFGLLIDNLPPSSQQQIVAAVRRKLESDDFFQSDSSNQRLSDYIDRGASVDVSSANLTPWRDSGFANQLQDGFTTSINGFRNNTSTLSSTQNNSNVHSRTLVQRYDTRQQDLKNTGGLVVELYIQSILEYYKNDMYTMLEILNRFPGSQLVARLIVLSDCPQPPLFQPSVLDFIKDIELPFCRGTDDITFPILRNPFAWVPRKNDITGQIQVALDYALSELMYSVLTRLMVKLCNLLGTTACQTLKSTGKVLANWGDINDRDKIINTIRDSICGPDASLPQVQNTVAEMFEKLGLGAEALADREKLLEFTGDLSNSLTRTELANLFLGSPSSESLAVISELIDGKFPSYSDALPSDTAIADLFNGMGNLMPVEFRKSLQDFADNLPEGDNVPANPSLCASPQDIEDFCNFRASILQGRATPEQARLLCDNDHDELAEKLEDLANALQQGPSNMISDAMPQIMSDPGCNNGIIPYEPEVITNTVNKSMNFVMNQIFVDFSTDMLGNGPGEKNWGLVNMILSDTLGTPLTAHYRRSFNRKNYVDFLTDDVLLIEQKEGQFPLYVAEWMRSELENLEIFFNTNNNYREDQTFTKSFSDLGLSLFGGVSAIELPDFGYNAIAVPDSVQEVVNITKKARKSDPDLTIKFRDNNKGKVEHQGSSFLYGFDLNLFMSDISEQKVYQDEGISLGEPKILNLPHDTARVSISNLLNFAADMTRAEARSMSKEEKNSYSPNEPSIQEEKLFEFLVTDQTFSVNEMDDFPEFQQCFVNLPDNVPQLVLFHEMLTQKGYSGTIDELKQIHDNTLNTILQKITSEIASNNNAFKYGAKYDSLSAEDADYVVQDGQTDSPGGTLYSKATIDGRSITNDDAILGISRDQYNNRDTSRVFYLDPGLFGGTYVNPPIYIMPLKNEGWLGLIDLMFPELSPCKPSRTDLVDFGDISDQIEETYNNTPIDERLQYDEDCVVELPYHRILERYSTAVIQGVITAACRIYSCAHFVKTMATFTTFKPDFDNMYSSIYPQYIVENMEISFRDAQSATWERLNPFKDEEFWYAFLEQSVQTYSRLVDSGKIDPPESVLKDLYIINDMQEKYNYPSKESWKNSQDLTTDIAKATALGLSVAAGTKFIPGVSGLAALSAAGIGFARNFETYKEYKERLKYEAIKSTESQAKNVLKEMVKLELQNMANKFSENLEQIGVTPKYTDIGYFVLTEFTAGGIDLDLNKEIVAVSNEEPSGPSYGTTSNVANHVHTYEVDENGNGWAYMAYHPTEPRIKHKHEIINWEVQVAQSECYPDCKDLFGNDGLGPHIHNISNMIVPIGDVESYGYLPTTQEVSETTQAIIDAAIQVVEEALEALSLSPENSLLEQAYETAIAALEAAFALYGIDMQSYFDFDKPFIIEKYVKINDVKYGIEEGSALISNNPPTSNISDIYPGTLKLIYPLGKVIKAQENSDFTGFRAPPDEDAEPVGLTGELGVRHGLQFSALINGEKFEITSVEIDALDYQIQQFVPVQANSKELLCLLKMLKEDQKFKLTTNYVFPVNKLLSITAIYNDMAFLPSIGEKTVANGVYAEGGFAGKPGMKVEFDEDGNLDYSSSTEGWASADDRAPSPFSGWFVREWDNWDQEILINSKGRLKSIFKAHYNSRDFQNNFDGMFSFDPVEFAVSEFKSKLKPPLGKAILPRWRRKNLKSNPFDSKGTLCKKQD
jgi:hypothetical protein